MPNDVMNMLEFNCSSERFREIVDATCIGDNEDIFDFNKIIPMPESLNVESSSAGDDGFQKYKEYMQAISLARNWKDNERCKFSSDLYETCIKQLVGKYESEYRAKEVFVLGKTYYENQLQYGHTTWYGWRCDKWGSKWNAYDGSVGDGAICFYTAWSCVRKVIQKMSEMFPDVEISYSWADEDIGNNTGSIEYLNGKVIDSHIPNDGSKEAFDIYGTLWGFDTIEECGYVFNGETGEYEYKEE